MGIDLTPEEDQHLSRIHENDAKNREALRTGEVGRLRAGLVGLHSKWAKEYRERGAWATACRGTIKQLEMFMYEHGIEPKEKV